MNVSVRTRTVVSNRVNVSVADCSPKYKIGATVLCWSDQTRDLGVIIDKQLNFNSHISAIAHKTHVRVSLIFIFYSPQG